MKSLTKENKRKNKKASDIPQMPFDDALRTILNAPPKHKEKKKESLTRRTK
jgi:hypothetical protein